MKSRARRNLLLVSVSLIAVAALGIYALHNRAKWAVASYQKKLRAAGEKLSVDEMLPRAVPPNRNSAALFQKATWKFNGAQSVLDTNLPLAMRMVAPGKAMIGWAQPEVIDCAAHAWVTNAWKDVEAALAEKSETLNLLRELISRPTVDQNLDYSQGYSLLLPHLAPCKRSAQQLSASALCELRRGD